MAPKYAVFVVFFQLFTLNVVIQTFAFPTPASTEDKTVYNRQLTEEKPLIDQIAEADSVKAAVLSAGSKHPAASKDTAQDNDDFSALKSLAEGQKSKMESEDVPDQSSQKSDRFVPDESDSTKNRRLAEDYDSTKNGMSDGKYQDVPESFRQVDGTPLTAEDIVQKIANKIYEEDDRGVFDRIVSRLLKLGLITDSEADSLEYQVAEALQKLITKNAQKNEVEETEESEEPRGEEEEQDSDANTWESSPQRRFNDDEEEEGGEEGEEGAEEEKNMEDGEGDDGGDMTGDERWDRDAQNEVSPNDGLQDLQYFPNFYRLLRSLDSERDTQERETLITIMKTLIDFVKMMVKYGTITPEEGVSYLENLDAMIALQTKNKLGKSLGPADFTVAGKSVDEDDNTKAEAAKMQKEYENLKDSTKEEQPSPDTSRPGKSETYLEAIRKNIEWLKKHSKEEGKDDYDLSKLKDFMDQQVDSYIEKGIISKDEGGTIKRIYSSL
ncbi:secretogranin-3 isoform X2 [Periophthalmus magnuspinnatus]|uniref:secretogranin-3 isoform X2 n=1 Tax=Periophthalmus magnuspinnatus TaxID=409849 RepID=UPI00145BD90F|nr:secretogranin-3 isoform X2 [Periophthalmus magnuspinnatus]